MAGFSQNRNSKVDNARINGLDLCTSRTRVGVARGHPWCRPYLHRAVVAARREHKWVGSRIPSDASHVAPQSWRADMVQVGCGLAVPYMNIPGFSCTEHEFIVSSPEGTGPREIHRSLGDVRMTKRQRHRLDWVDLFPIIERHQFP